jgi:transglycosylase-like protein with SLT domain
MVAAFLAALALALPAQAPAPSAPIPRDPDALADRLEETHSALLAGLGGWTGGEPPREVTLHALHQQRIHVLLTGRPMLAARVLRRLPRPVASHLRTTVVARRELAEISPPVPLSRFRVCEPEEAHVLLGHYRKAQRRFGVRWPLLAAVNFVESAFGRLCNESVAGARGPMQFIPSTWEAYGMGGDVRDPHDAIMGAANYLRASGGRSDEPRALFAYNPSTAYVDAVLGFANQIRRDRRAYLGYWAWQVFVRTPGGIKRITGPGATRPRSPGSAPAPR